MKKLLMMTAAAALGLGLAAQDALARHGDPGGAQTRARAGTGNGTMDRQRLQDGSCQTTAYGARTRTRLRDPDNCTGDPADAVQQRARQRAQQRAFRLGLQVGAVNQQNRSRTESRASSPEDCGDRDRDRDRLSQYRTRSRAELGSDAAQGRRIRQQDRTCHEQQSTWTQTRRRAGDGTGQGTQDRIRARDGSCQEVILWSKTRSRAGADSGSGDPTRLRECDPATSAVQATLPPN